MPRNPRSRSGSLATRFVTTAVALTAAFAASSLEAEDWPQFRGQNGSSVTTSSAPLLTEFSEKAGVLWSHTIGDGIASPVISQGRLFVTTMSSPEEFSVVSYDAATGKERWRTSFPSGKLPTVIFPNVPASSTPATDGERVYVYFCTIGIVALDANDGRELWRTPVPEPFYLMAWGSAASPIVYQDLVIFSQDDDLAPMMYAFDRQTGKTVWKVSRPDMLAGYSLPVIVKTPKRTELVVAGTGKMKGYDPLTGKELWTCNTLLRTIMTSPVVKDDVVYISVQSYGDADRLLKDALLEWRDTNQDGKLSKQEIAEAFWDKFAAGDADKDGFLVGAEIDAAFQSVDNRVGGGSIIEAIRCGGDGDVTKTHLVWRLDNKASSNIASPILVGERLLVIKQGGISSCFAAGDGKTIWMLKRLQNLGNYYASPVAGDGKIFIAGENGFIVVLRDADKMEILAKNDMGESIIATPALADGRLYVRSKTKLFCVGSQ